MADVASLDINIKTNGDESAKKGLESLTTAGAKTEKQVESLQGDVVMLNSAMKSTGSSARIASTSINRVGTSFKSNSFAIQNSAFQLQDIVTQLEMGTSVSRTLSQQLPQIFGAFGPIGAITGLVSGLAFAIGGPLVNSLVDGANASNELADAMEDLDVVVSETESGVNLLAMEISELADRSRVAALTQIQLQILNLEEALGGVRAELGELGDDLVATFFSTISGFDEAIGAVELYGLNWQSLQRTLDLSAEQAEELAVIFKRFGNGLKNEKGIGFLREEFETFFLTLDDPDEKLIEFAEGLSKLDERSVEATEKLDFLRKAFTNLDDVIANQSEESVQLDEIDRAAQRAQEILMRREAREAESLARDEQRLEDHLERMEDLKNRERERDLLARERYEADKKLQLERQRDDEIDASIELAGAIGNISGGLSDLIASTAGEQSEAYKAAFALSKGFATAQASLNFALALSQALALPADVSLASKFASYTAVATAGGSVLSSLAGVSYNGGRLQGGTVGANDAVMVGERGPELFVPGNSGRVVNNNQLNNQSSGEMNVTIVNQTTGRIDKVEKQQISRNDVVLIIQETVPLEIANANSRTSKALKNNTNSQRRLS